MAPMKRPASASAASPQAKAPRTTPVDAKVTIVADAVAKAKGFPESVQRMLSAHTVFALGVPKEERHPFQAQVVTMIGEVLSTVETAAKEEVTATEAKVTELGGSKSTLDASAEAAMADVEAKTKAVEDANRLLGEAIAASTASKTALVDAQDAHMAQGVRLETVASKKATLESTLAGLFVPLKEGTYEDVRGGVQLLMKACKQYEFDTSLMSSIRAALSKQVAHRGSFDGMVITQAEAEIKQKISELGEALAAAEPAKEASAEKVTASAKEVDAAIEKESGCRADWSAAQTALAEAKLAAKAAQKVVMDFTPNMKQATAAFESATAALAKFSVGPLAAYAELLELSNAPPPALEEAATEEAATVEAVTAEASAEAPAAAEATPIETAA